MITWVLYPGMEIPCITLLQGSAYTIRGCSRPQPQLSLLLPPLKLFWPPLTCWKHYTKMHFNCNNGSFLLESLRSHHSDHSLGRALYLQYYFCVDLMEFATWRLRIGVLTMENIIVHYCDTWILTKTDCGRVQCNAKLTQHVYAAPTFINTVRDQ